jgi:hypothetical protein
MSMKQELIGYVAFAILVPFVLVSTWFGISAVNHHFKGAEKVAEQVERDERQSKYDEYMRCVTKTVGKADKTSSEHCIFPRK